MEILLLPLRFQQQRIFKWTFCENQPENPVSCKRIPFDAKKLTSYDACDTLNSQDILNLFLKKVYLNETDFQKGITGSSFHCKKTASFSANIPCIWWQYQPKTPKSVKKMRKFWCCKHSRKNLQRNWYRRKSFPNPMQIFMCSDAISLEWCS